MYKAVAFDVDGTLVKEVSSWLTVHEKFETKDKARTNLKLYENGKIDYSEFMKRDIGLWPHPLHINQIDEILSGYNLDPSAKLIVHQLKQKKYNVVLVSAGIDLLVKKVAQDLGISDFRANGLEVDIENKLTGNGVYRVDLLRKDKALIEILESINCKPEECVSVGDSKYDKTMLEYSGCAIALGSGEHTEKADHQISDLSEIMKILK